jgi:hypothetical protein
MANYQNIIPIQLGQLALTTAYQTVYTVPAITRTFIKTIDMANTTAAPIGVYISLVPAAGTASANNSLFYNVSIPAYSVLQWNGTQLMNIGGSLQAKASATGLTLTCSGAEAT